MPSNTVPFPAPENQPPPEKRSVPAPWLSIRRQLCKLIAKGHTEPISRQTMTIIFGPGMIGPENGASCEAGILLITGQEPKYFQRAKRAFQNFHKAYYGYELDLPDWFTADDLRTYRLVFCWERARKAFNAQANLRQNQK